MLVNPCVDPATAAVELSCDLRGRRTGTIPFDSRSATVGVVLVRSCGVRHHSPPQWRCVCPMSTMF